MNERIEDLGKLLTGLWELSGCLERKQQDEAACRFMQAVVHECEILVTELVAEAFMGDGPTSSVSARLQ